MRWKFSGDGSNIYTCCWCCHVKTGTLLLGIWSLMTQVAALAVVTFLVLHENIEQPWLASFMSPKSVGTPNNSCCGMMGSGGHMMDGSTMMPSPMMPAVHDAMMGTGNDGAAMMPGGGGMMGSGGRGPMMGDGAPWRDRMMGSGFDGDNGMMGDRGGMMGDGMMGKKMMDSDFGDWLQALQPEKGAEAGDGEQIGIRTSDIVQKPDVIPESDDIKSPGKLAGNRNWMNDSDDKFFVIVMIFGCIAASMMLIYGVMRGWPGYMMPYMGLQVFDFCMSCITVFTYFSDIPGVKRWLTSQPDSFPLKSYLMSMDTDRLVLGLVLASVGILVVKAYLMGVVWSCYKYLKQVQAGGINRRRSADDDSITNPEDTEMLLPPKYEDVINIPAAEAANPPPPYNTA